MCVHRDRVGDEVTHSTHVVNGAKIKINSFWPCSEEGNHRSTGKKKYKTTHVQNILSFINTLHLSLCWFTPRLT